jgi:molybdopterin synthase catalytic subunit
MLETPGSMYVYSVNTMMRSNFFAPSAWMIFSTGIFILLLNAFQKDISVLVRITCPYFELYSRIPYIHTTWHPLMNRIRIQVQDYITEMLQHSLDVMSMEYSIVCTNVVQSLPPSLPPSPQPPSHYSVLQHLAVLSYDVIVPRIQYSCVHARECIVIGLQYVCLFFLWMFGGSTIFRWLECILTILWYIHPIRILFFRHRRGSSTRNKKNSPQNLNSNNNSHRPSTTSPAVTVHDNTAAMVQTPRTTTTTTTTTTTFTTNEDHRFIMDITEHMPTLEECYQFVAQDPSCGAVSTFVGITRNHYQGKVVSKLSYEAYIPMAKKELDRIYMEAVTTLYPSIRRMVVVHVMGDCPVGSPSVMIACASPHRTEAIQCCEYMIHQVKARLPIWKLEVYVGDTSVWKENIEWFKQNTTAPGGSASASSSRRVMVRQNEDDE